MIKIDEMAWARRLKVKHLESFLVLDEAGTLTGAAARMHMTQSAMSHWLADLEELVGMQLVTRGRRVQLTPAGVLVKRLAISVLGDISRTHKELGAVAKGLTARLQIGSVWAGVARVLPQALAEFHEPASGTRKQGTRRGRRIARCQGVWRPIGASRIV